MYVNTHLLGGRELSLVPPCQTTSSIPDNGRNMIRSVKIHRRAPWPREQGLFSVAPQLRTPFTPCLYLIILILCIFLSVFPHPPWSSALITELLSLSGSVTQAYLFWPIFFLHTLNRCSGVSRNPSLSHLRSVCEFKRLILGQPVLYCV